MSLCCVTRVDERSAIKIEGYAPLTTARSAIKPPRRFHHFMRRTTISHFSFLISHSIEAFKRNQGASRPRG